MAVELSASPKFLRSYKKLPFILKEKAKRREQIFLANPFDPRLGTHKLRGTLKEEWAYRVDDSYRISFVFINGSNVLYTDIGTHEIYKK